VSGAGETGPEDPGRQAGGRADGLGQERKGRGGHGEECQGKGAHGDGTGRRWIRECGLWGDWFAGAWGGLVPAMEWWDMRGCW